jgi:HSP20 family protein
MTPTSWPSGLPGVRKQDLDIEIAGRRLTVHVIARRCNAPASSGGEDEPSAASTTKSPCPSKVDEDGIVANVADGVLTVRVPKPESERHRRIAVH